MKNTSQKETVNNHSRTSKFRFRRSVWLGSAAVVIAVAVVGYLGVQEAKALDSRLVNACTHALAGKCFHAGELPQPIDSVFSVSDAQNYCIFQSEQHCDLAECTGRVSVLVGIAVSSQGDPCTP